MKIKKNNYRDIKYTIVIIFISLFNISFSQIQIGTTTSKDKKKITKIKNKKNNTIQKNKKNSLGEGKLSIYFGYAPTYSFRNLKKREGLFGKPLGLLQNEKPTWTHSVSIGTRTNLNKFLALDIGFAYLQTGEMYSFSEKNNDSTYQYKNTYHNIAINLNVLAKYRIKDFTLYLGGGVSPNMFLKLFKHITYTTAKGDVNKNTNKLNDGFQSINLDIVGKVGFAYHINSFLSIYLMPEFRYGIIDTYSKQEPHTRNSFGLAIDFGFSIDF